MTARLYRCVALADMGGDEPSPRAFAPNSGDTNEMARRGLSGPRISLWDAEQVTVEQIRAARPGKPFRVYEISREDIEAVARAFDHPLTLVHDPDPSIAVIGGAHWGLDGCGPQRGSTDKDKDVRAELARRLRVAE